MFWNRKQRGKPAVRVEFFDAATGRLFAQTDLSPDKLPASFEYSTTLHLGGQDWEVVRAEPMTADRFTRTGRLRLVVAKVEIRTIDPTQVLYSLPTISDGLPPIAPASSKLNRDRATLDIQEDDWRQSEFVSSRLLDCIEQELASVRRIYEEEREGAGFRTLHPRKAMASPLAGTDLDVPAVRAACGAMATPLDGVSFTGVAGLVSASFAVRLLSSLEVYGLHDERGRVVVLAVHARSTNNVAMSGMDGVVGMAVANDLCLVDWCRCELVPPEQIALREALRRDSD